MSFFYDLDYLAKLSTCSFIYNLFDCHRYLFEVVVITSINLMGFKLQRWQKKGQKYFDLCDILR